MTEHMTESRVLINREKENAFLQRSCLEAAERGGRYEISQAFIDGDWRTVYKIWWPLSPPPGTALSTQHSGQPQVKSADPSEAEGT